MKGIDKKACKSFLNPRRSLDLNSGLFYVEQIEYIVCTAIRIVGHRKLLILDFYPRAEAVKGMPSPDFTMFQATDDFITFDHRDGVKTRWRTAILDNLERTYNFIFKWNIIDKNCFLRNSFKIVFSVNCAWSNYDIYMG